MCACVCCSVTTNPKEYFFLLQAAGSETAVFIPVIYLFLSVFMWESLEITKSLQKTTTKEQEITKKLCNVY